MWTVPAPSALDGNAEPAKEIGVAEKAAERLAAQPPAPQSPPPTGGADA
jgi:hypothetical protein